MSQPEVAEANLERDAHAAAASGGARAVAAVARAAAASDAPPSPLARAPPPKAVTATSRTAKAPAPAERVTPTTPATLKPATPAQAAGMTRTIMCCRRPRHCRPHRRRCGRGCTVVDGPYPCLARSDGLRVPDARS